MAINRNSGKRSNRLTTYEKDSDPTSERPKFRPHRAPRSSNIPSINALKTKIRTLTRVLEHNDDLPPGVRIEKERALAGYRQDLQYANQEKRKQAIIGKYHMVRFFGQWHYYISSECVWNDVLTITRTERQKATRSLRKAKKHFQATTPNTPEYAQALQDVHIAEVDLNYTLYCPLAEKYESIFPNHTSIETGQTHRDGHYSDETDMVPPSRPAMWSVVEGCMNTGMLDALREGKLTKSMSVGRKRPPEKKKKGMRDHERGPGGGVMLDSGKAATREAKLGSGIGGDESDGGFFER